MQRLVYLMRRDAPAQDGRGGGERGNNVSAGGKAVDRTTSETFCGPGPKTLAPNPVSFGPSSSSAPLSNRRNTKSVAVRIEKKKKAISPPPVPPVEPPPLRAVSSLLTTTPPLTPIYPPHGASLARQYRQSYPHPPPPAVLLLLPPSVLDHGGYHRREWFGHSLHAQVTVPCEVSVGGDRGVCAEERDTKPTEGSRVREGRGE